MCDDYDDDDELPPISVISSTRESDVLSMPSAEELASQRAREAECERELEKLRAQHKGDIAMTTDSSGSEGEAALAAAVNGLLVRSTDPTPTFPSEGTLLQELLPHLVTSEAKALLQADPEVLEALTDDVCVCVQRGCVRAPDEAAAALCWLLAAGGSTRARRRALLLLLEDRTLTEEVAARLAPQLSRALVSPAARVSAADRLAPALPRSPAARRLHAALLAGPWAGGPWAARAAARVLAATRRPDRDGGGGGGGGVGGARAQLMHELAAPPAHRHHHHDHDRLEVLVGASKLRLLFRE